MPYLFTPPGDQRPIGADRLWARFSLPVSFALLKKDGFYTLTETPADEDVAAADLAYLGGHTYLVSDTEADSLRAHGYGANLTPANGGGSGAYGVGLFGVGPYGTGQDNQTPTDLRPYGAGKYSSGTYDGQG